MYIIYMYIKSLGLYNSIYISPGLIFRDFDLIDLWRGPACVAV